jgi:ribonuclease HII
MDLENVLVGAASILAKVHRDNEIEKIGQLLNLDIGSGYPSDPKTKVAIRELIKGDLPNKYLRWSWATVENIWKKENGKPIPERGQKEGNSKQSSISDW